MPDIARVVSRNVVPASLNKSCSTKTNPAPRHWRQLLPLAATLVGSAVARPGAAQPAPAASPPPTFYATYRYQRYTVVNPDSGEPPTQIPGAGGTLTLRPDGSYDKRLRLPIGDGPPRAFDQQGQFTTLGDSIFFRFADKNGADTQRGQFQFQPATRRLQVTIAGYPPGNAGIYELSAAPDSLAQLVVAPVTKPTTRPTAKPAANQAKRTARPHAVRQPAARPR